MSTNELEGEIKTILEYVKDIKIQLIKIEKDISELKDEQRDIIDKLNGN